MNDLRPDYLTQAAFAALDNPANFAPVDDATAKLKEQQRKKFNIFFQELRELVKKHDIKFVTSAPVPTDQDWVDIVTLTHVVGKVGETHMVISKSRRVSENKWVKENGVPFLAPFPFKLDVDPRVAVLMEKHGYTEKQAKYYLHIRDQLAKRETEQSLPPEREPVVVLTRVGRIMAQYACSAEDAQRFIDYRDDGHGQHAAAVMAGLADPGE